MAISPSVLLSASSSLDGTSFVTSSASPTALSLQTLVVLNQASVTAGIPTVTGQGLTWVQVTTQTTAAGDARVTVLRALGSASSGALTIDFGSDTQLCVAYKQIEWSDINTGGSNGSDAIAQYSSVQVGGGSALTLTLGGSLANENNAEFGVWVSKANTTFTVEGGWSEVDAEQTVTSPSGTLATAWRIGEDLSVVGTFGTTGSKAGIIMEIVQSGAGGGGGQMVRVASARMMGLGR